MHDNVWRYLKARFALLSANVMAWLLSFLSSAEAKRANRERTTMLVVFIFSVSSSSHSSLRKIAGEKKKRVNNNVCL